MEKVRLRLLFLFSFLSFIPSLWANIEMFDDYWEKRAEEARKDALEAYHHNPQDIVNHFAIPTNMSYEEESSRRSLAESTRGKKFAISANMSSSGIENEGRRRSLAGRGRGRKHTGPCRATNPMDKCWRCKRNWARNRKKLATCVRGFAHRTRGGMRGRIYVVTSNKDDNVLDPKPGTLRYGVIQKEPRWIIFKRDMHIKLSQELMVASHKTIDARGANVHIAYGAGITIQFVKNVIIHGLHIHHIVGSNGGMIRDSVDHFGVRTASDGDGISIFGSTNIWLDHLSMSKCQDGLIDAIQGSTAITISNCHFTHHNDVILLGASDSYSGDKIMQVTVAYNHFGKGLVQRMPRCRWGFFHVVNNDYTHWEMYAIGGSMNPTILSQGNRFVAPPHKPFSKEVTKRDYASPDKWKKWIWKSEKDVMMNGAFFVQSGNPKYVPPFSRKDIIKAKHGMAASLLSRYAGSLDCYRGKPC